MLLKRSLLSVIIISIVALAGCNTGQKEKSNEDEKDKISAEFKQKRNELQEKANEQLSEINEKVKELNKKVESQSEGLSDQQTEMLNDLQGQREKVNEKLYEIKDVSEEEWGQFKSEFNSELKKLRSDIDEILEEF